MAIVLGNGPTDSGLGPGNGTVSSSITATAGNSAIIEIHWGSTISTPTVTLTGETVTLIGSPLTSAALGESRQLAYVKNLSGSGTKTLAVSGGGAGVNVVTNYTDWSGGDTTTWYDGAEGGATGTALTGPTVTITTNTASDMIFASIGNLTDVAGNCTAGAGYTLTHGTAALNAFADLERNTNVGAAGSQTATATLPAGSTTANWMIKAAAFKPAAPSDTLMGAICL